MPHRAALLLQTAARRRHSFPPAAAARVHSAPPGKDRRIMNRRTFLGTTSIGLASTLVPSRGRAAANSKVVLGVMGTNSRGAALARNLAKLPGVELAYI